MDKTASAADGAQKLSLIVKLALEEAIKPHIANMIEQTKLANDRVFELFAKMDELSSRMGTLQKDLAAVKAEEKLARQLIKDMKLEPNANPQPQAAPGAEKLEEIHKSVRLSRRELHNDIANAVASVNLLRGDIGGLTPSIDRVKNEVAEQMRATNVHVNAMNTRVQEMAEEVHKLRNSVAVIERGYKEEQRNPLNKIPLTFD